MRPMVRGQWLEANGKRQMGRGNGKWCEARGKRQISKEKWEEAWIANTDFYSIASIDPANCVNHFKILCRSKRSDANGA